MGNERVWMLEVGLCMFGWPASLCRTIRQSLCNIRTGTQLITNPK